MGVRVIVGVSLVAISMLAVAIGISYGVLIRSYDAVEADQTADKATQALRAFEADLNQLALSTRDYAEWDEVFRYLTTLDPAFIADNFSYETLDGLHVDVMAILDRDGKLLYGAQVDAVEPRVQPTIAGNVLDAVRALKPQVGKAVASNSLGRILRMHDELLAFSIVEIRRSDRTQPTGAALFFGRYIAADEIERTRRTSLLPVELTVIGARTRASTSLPPAIVSGWRHGDPADVAKTAVRDSRHLTGYRLISDWSGAPVAVVSVAAERDIGLLGRRTTFILMGTISILAVLFAGSMALMLIRLRGEWSRRLSVTDRHQRVLACLHETIVLADPEDGRIVEANDALLRTLDYSHNDLEHLTLGEIYVDIPGIARSLSESGDDVRDCRMRARDGRLIETELNATSVWGQDQALICIVARDVSQRRQAERSLKEYQGLLDHLTGHDALTGLPNRKFLQTTLPDLVRSAAENRQALALFYVDVDHFRQATDSGGQQLVDQVLKILASRLRKDTAPADTVLRLGDDEFVVIAFMRGAPTDTLKLGERLLASVRIPIRVDAVELSLTASIGIAVYPQDGNDSESLLRHADIALYQAKEDGRNCCHLFRDDMTVRFSEQVAIEQALRRAIATDQIHVEYQPIVDLHNGKLVSFEALARWTHPEWGNVTPRRFIPVAEKSNLIVMLGDQIMHTVMREMRDWQLRGLTPVPVAINVTAVQLERPDFAIRVRDAALEHSIDPKLLAFEFAEAIHIGSSSRKVATIAALGKVGSRIQIDDFGAGYAGQGQLQALPIDALKIDQSLIRHIDTDASDAAIVGAIVTMARRLLLDTIAEGIETTEHAERLRGLGCRYGQGYYFSHPMPASGCHGLLEQLAASRTHTRTLKMRAFRQ